MKKSFSTEDTSGKKRIIEAAKLLFSQKGYLGTSIEDIISAAGSSKGNLYHHFSSKEGLFLYLIREQIEQWLEQWEMKRSEYKTFEEVLYGLAHHVALDLENPLARAAEEFSSSETANPRVLEEIVTEIQKQREVFLQVIREGIEKGHLQSNVAAEDLSVILYALLGGLGAVRHEYSIEKIIELHRSAIHIFLNGSSSHLL